MFETTLQKNIKARLEEKNISIAELERRAGLRHAVINIMHGRSKNPSIRVAQAIAKELGCTVEELLAEKKDYPAVLTTESTNSYDNVDLANHLNTKKKDWEPLVAIAALEAINKYLMDNALSPCPTAVFQCVNEIYQYTIKTPTQQIDSTFVDWIADKTFARSN